MRCCSHSYYDAKAPKPGGAFFEKPAFWRLFNPLQQESQPAQASSQNSLKGLGAQNKILEWVVVEVHKESMGKGLAMIRVFQAFIGRLYAPCCALRPRITI